MMELKNMKGSIFMGQNVSGTDFSNTDLSGSNFVGSDCSECNFEGAILDFINFKGADLTGSTFSNETKARFIPWINTDKIIGLDKESFSVVDTTEDETEISGDTFYEDSLYYNEEENIKEL